MSLPHIQELLSGGQSRSNFNATKSVICQRSSPKPESSDGVVDRSPQTYVLPELLLGRRRWTGAESWEGSKFKKGVRTAYKENMTFLGAGLLGNGSVVRPQANLKKLEVTTVCHKTVTQSTADTRRERALFQERFARLYNFRPSHCSDRLFIHEATINDFRD